MALFLKRTWRRALGKSRPVHDALELSDTPYPSPPPATASSTRTLPPFDFEDLYTKNRGEDVNPLFAHAPAEYTEQHGILRPPPRQSVGWIATKMRDWWIREILSLFCSLVSILTLIGVLAVHDNKPLKGSNSVSLNAYVAIFATIAKAGFSFAVMNCVGQLKWIWFFRRSAPLADFAAYDDATRGPWDSLMLLARLKFWHTASFGALVLVLSTAVSPLTQQTLSYPSRLVANSTHLPAYVPTSNFWDGSTDQRLPTDPLSGVLSLPMKQAVNNALYTPSTETLTAIEPSCPSANCAWEEYDSLSVCSKVNNVTDLLVIANNEIFGSVISNVTLPNGAALNYGIVKTNISSSPSQNVLRDNSTLGLAINFGYIIYEATGRNSKEIQGSSPVFNALEMVHYWCVNTYSTSVDHGIASTKIVESSHQITYNQGNIYDNITIAPPKGDASFNVTGNSHHILRQFMSDIFQGSYAGGYPGHFGGPSSDLAYILQPIVTANTSSLVMEGISNYSQSMATSMSNSVRTHVGNGLPPQNVISIAGTTYVFETFVQVRWRWLLLLMGLVAASILFLIGTIIKTSRCGVAVMKSDALAAVTILGPKARMGYTDMKRGTVRRAEELRVKLRRGAEGWSLDAV